MGQGISFKSDIIIQFLTISGRQFDKHGNLKQWWNNKTIAEFRKAAQCIVDQVSFNNYVDIILPFFDHLPTSTWTFFTLNVEKWRFLDHLSTSSCPRSY